MNGFRQGRSLFTDDEIVERRIAAPGAGVLATQGRFDPDASNGRPSCFGAGRQVLTVRTLRGALLASPAPRTTLVAQMRPRLRPVEHSPARSRGRATDRQCGRRRVAPPAAPSQRRVARAIVAC